MLWNGLEAVRVVAVALLPVMPTVATQILAAIGVREAPTSLDALTWGGLPGGAEVPERPALFPRIDKKAYLASIAPEAEPLAAVGQDGNKEEEASDEGLIDFEQFMATELKVATVRAAEVIPKSKKLLKLTVELGEEVRTVVAGIASQYQPEDLVGRQVVVVANLKPAKLMGVRSQGMVLAASVDGAPILLRPDRTVPSGTRAQ